MLVLLLPSLLFADAIEDYTKAIKLNPNDADAFYNRGVSYYFKDQYDMAIEIIIFPENEEKIELIESSESSLKFWDNPIDDEVWNNE